MPDVHTCRGRCLPAAAILLFLGGCSSGLEKADSVSIEIVDYGIFGDYEVEKGRARNLVVAETTDTVPFLTGTRYGVLFRVDGEPDGAEIQLKMQWAVTPASVTGKRKLARLSQPRYRNVTIGQLAVITSTIGNQSWRRPYRNLMYVTDMNGKVLARKEFTVVDADGGSASAE